MKENLTYLISKNGRRQPGLEAGHFRLSEQAPLTVVCPFTLRTETA